MSALQSACHTLEFLRLNSAHRAHRNARPPRLERATSARFFSLSALVFEKDEARARS